MVCCGSADALLSVWLLQLILCYSCKVRLVLLKVGGNNCLLYCTDSTEQTG